jgi:uncharacterized protein (TIGR02996 family)
MAFRTPDWLLLDGQRRMLLDHPLDAYLRKLPSQPDFRITDVDNTHGYVATWEVRPDDTLWLTDLVTRPADDGPDPGLKLVFPDASGPIPANWVSQRLRCVTGDRRYSPHRDWVFSRESHLRVLCGRIVLKEEIVGTTDERLSASFTSHLESIFGSEEAAFIRAAHANPKDSAPRLVYADWLDERGDPRGALIRLEERLRELDPASKAAHRAAHRPETHAGERSQLWEQLMGYRE